MHWPRASKALPVGDLPPKKEAFAIKYVECGNASKAYRETSDVGEDTANESVWQSASRIMADVKVASRIMELQLEAQERHAVTVDSLTIELDENREAAKLLDQPAAMNAATMGKAKLHGHLVDKSEAKVVITGIPLSKDVAGI